MILTEGRFEFDFTDAIDAFKFDEKDRKSSTFHGLSHCMKAVDFIVERAECWVFIEVKDFKHPNQSQPKNLNDSNEYNNFVKSLVSKYRDTFLYRWAENKIEGKPVKYVCFIETENAMVMTLMTKLKKELPEGSLNPRWQKGIAQSVVIANRRTWNSNIFDWAVSETTV